jgi:hypothetical protein
MRIKACTHQDYNYAIDVVTKDDVQAILGYGRS